MLLGIAPGCMDNYRCSSPSVSSASPGSPFPEMSLRGAVSQFSGEVKERPASPLPWTTLPSPEKSKGFLQLWHQPFCPLALLPAVNIHSTAIIYQALS